MDKSDFAANIAFSALAIVTNCARDLAERKQMTPECGALVAQEMKRVAELLGGLLGEDPTSPLFDQAARLHSTALLIEAAVKRDD